VRRNASTFDFREGDEVVRLARAHGMKVRGHCLVWDHGHPEWLVQAHFTTAQLSGLLQEHTTAVMKHYAGQVFAWDLVNEAFDEKGQVKNSLWYNQPGIALYDRYTGYIEQAFRCAHQADPPALLFYNDNGGEELNPKSDAIDAMVKDFKRRGVPIDGVWPAVAHPAACHRHHGHCLQYHTSDRVRRAVHITELDVSLPLENRGEPRTDDLRRQAEVYRGVVRVLQQNPGCSAIQTWGFTDKYWWIGSPSHGASGAALLFDRAYKPKPAYSAMDEAISSSRSRR
jgi:endo-1,4-beta-xylanase